MTYRDDAYSDSIAAEEFPSILTPLEVMDLLGVGKNTIYRLLNSGELRGFRIGRGWRITEESLREFMNIA